MERGRSCADEVAGGHLDETEAWLSSMHDDSRFEHAGGECDGIVALLSNEKQDKFRTRETIHERTI
jgi:hypothetical protein